MSAATPYLMVRLPGIVPGSLNFIGQHPMQRTRPAIVVALTCALAACANGGTSPAAEADTQIAAEVQARLDHEPVFKVNRLRVQAGSRVVYIYGLVDTQREAQEAEDVARAVPGVVEVVNLTAVSNSGAD
jgi:hypothetical protein